MPPWRDVRGERRLLARFVDGPLAGTERTVDAAPDGNAPPLLSIGADEPVVAGMDLVYELVSGGHGPSRYRVRD